MVTDFGAAKAISEAPGRTSLTSMGVALGTPAYMAPEQATADPHVDHRADLYALGALGYEMLTGRPPFVGTSPHQVLAAQVTELPDPVTDHRAAVPPALAALVMRCLEKKPADRWQSAAELHHQFEAMATPTGGMAPTEGPPIISSGTEAAIRRGHPARVATLFALRSEEHTSELQSLRHLVCRLLLEKKKNILQQNRRRCKPPGGSAMEAFRVYGPYSTTRSRQRRRK